VEFGTLYSCRPNITNYRNENLVEKVTGTHLSGNSFSDVKVLTIENKILNQIPKGIEGFFPNLKLIRLQRTNLKEISADDFKAFPNLISFSSWYNPLVKLESDLFKHTSKLQFIRFRNNLIEQVGENLLTNLRSLRKADFSGNVCIDFNAISRSEIEKLNEKLNENCLYLSTTTLATSSTTESSSECPADCLKEINLLKRKVDQQNEVIGKMQKKIENIENKILNMQKQIDDLQCVTCPYRSIGNSL
jgi:methyl-accepting chemotaxis protein